MKCKGCKDTQYCVDCKEEQKKVNAEKKTSRKSRHIPVSMKGNILHFKGRNFSVSKVEDRNPNKKVTTREGFIFYLREGSQGYILIKTKVIKPKNGKPDFCEKCYDLLIGKSLPPKLIEDTNW